MKKAITLTALLFLVLLAGCSADPEYKIEVTKPIYFQPDTEVPFEIKVTEKKKQLKVLMYLPRFR